NAAIPAPTPEDLVAATTNSIVLAKSEYSKKQRAFTSGAGSSQDGVVVGSYEVSPDEWEGPHQPTMNILTREMFKDPNVCKIIVDQFPTPREMVCIESLTDECLAGKTIEESSTEAYFFPRLRILSYGFEEAKVTDITDKVTASDVAFVKAKAKRKERKKRHLPPSLCLSSMVVFRAWFESSLLVMSLAGFKVVSHSAHPLSAIVELEPNRLARPVVVPTSRVVVIDEGGTFFKNNFTKEGEGVIVNFFRRGGKT
nr:hypothetical protein [Tanacetum cinerariifolium]